MAWTIQTLSPFKKCLRKRKKSWSPRKDSTNVCQACIWQQKRHHLVEELHLDHPQTSGSCSNYLELPTGGENVKKRLLYMLVLTSLYNIHWYTDTYPWAILLNPVSPGKIQVCHFETLQMIGKVVCKHRSYNLPHSLPMTDPWYIYLHLPWTSAKW